MILSKLRAAVSSWLKAPCWKPGLPRQTDCGVTISPGY